jgi:hypothetical protein
MKYLLRNRLWYAVVKTSENGIISTMKQLSEWCAFLDYCERTPLRLSEDLGFEQPDDGTVHPLWFVGYGIFGESIGQSYPYHPRLGVLSCTSWLINGCGIMFKLIPN